MSRDKDIRAEVTLACNIRLDGGRDVIASGVTELLARDSVVVLVKTLDRSVKFTTNSTVIISVDLPCTGSFTPRSLECTGQLATISVVNQGLHITARVTRMEFRERSIAPKRHSCGRVRRIGVDQITAAAAPRMFNPMILRNRTTNLHNGENTMNFLKNLMIEEDGQDMVEYGLVIALVVLAAGAILTTFKGSLSTAFGALGTNVTTNIK